MANRKTKPAAVKSAAGKTNSKQNIQKAKQKQRAEAEKKAQKLIEEKKKAKIQQQKKSADIQKRRAKQSEKDKKAQSREQTKLERKNKRKSFAQIMRLVWEKFNYYTSKEFLSSFNYVRIFLFIVVPAVLIIFGISALIKTVPLNVPLEIRSYDFNGRTESDSVAKASEFNLQQQGVFIDSLNSHGSGKFKFYINSVIPVDDNCCTDELCFGNPSDNDCVLIATIFDEKGDIIYRSLGLESGKEVNEAKMFTSLSYGIHNVKVAVNAYDKKTNEKIGTRYAKIKLAVGVDENGK